MNITKNTIDDGRFNVELTDENNTITIEYDGGDLYWIMHNYYDNNLFKITREDNFLFLQMDELFRIVEKYDNPYEKVLNDNCFEWISEAYGLPEESNILTINRNADSYDMSFFNNPNRRFRNKNICCVCFCLSGSRNFEIANAFSRMLLEYSDFENQQIINLKRER